VRRLCLLALYAFGTREFSFFIVGFLTDNKSLLADFELNDDVLDFLQEIQESNRAEQHSQFWLESFLLALSSHLDLLNRL